MRRALRVVRRGLSRVRASPRLQFDWKLLGIGLACLLAAVFPGPVELPGLMTLPALTAAPQRIIAGVVGVVLVLLSVLLGTGAEAAGTADRPEGGEQRARDVRGRMLLRVRRFWMGDLPTHAGTGTDRLELRLRRRFDLVDRPLDLVRRAQEPSAQERRLPAGTSLHAVFEQVDQALLVLGPPGGGKTTLLLELLRDLLDVASRDARAPVPVVLNLSSWEPGVPIVQWLGDELHKQYGLPTRIARAWVHSDQVVPLLDGLDELAARARARCVVAINQFREEHGLVGVAVCCRTDEYVALGARLRLGGAVELEELDSQQVVGYLRSVGPSMAGVRAVLRDDPILAELLRSPLLLRLVASAYRDRSPRQIRSVADAGQRREEIFGAYVDTMFSRRPPSPRWTMGQLLHWLSRLANTMLERGQSVFRLEWMQPNLLSKRWRRWLVIATPAAVASLLVLVLLVLPPLGVLGTPPMSLAAGALSYGASVALFLVPVLLVSFDRRIRPWDKLAWSHGSLRRRFRRSFAWGLALALVVYAALAVGLWLGHDRPPELGDIRLILTVTIVVGSLIWLATALEGRLAEHYHRPNEGIRTSARNAIVLGLPPTVLGVLWAQTGTGTGLEVFAPFLTLAGLVVGFRVGGRAVVQHAALRVLLAAEGSAPLRYVDMLDAAVDLALLRRVGGGYAFLHRLLLEHLIQSVHRGAATQPGYQSVASEA